MKNTIGVVLLTCMRYIKEVCYFGRFQLSLSRWMLGACGPRSFVHPWDLMIGHRFIYIGSNVKIRKHARIEALQIPGRPAPRLEIGEGFRAELYLHLACAQEVKIGKDCLIAGRVYISDHDHGYSQLNVSISSQPLVTKPVRIGNFVWLGEGVAVLKGVVIGDNAIIGANSVVTKSIPANAIAAGVPARVIKFRE